MSPTVSVIILGWGGEKFVAACLEALDRQTYPAGEIIVVDNGSPDRTAAIVARDFPHVHLIRTGENLGVAGGNNVGLRAARGDILVLTNVDTEPRPDWLAQLVAAFESDPRIGIVGGKLLYPDGTVQYGGGRIDPLRGTSSHIAEHAPDDPDDTRIRDTDFATGAALALRREVLVQIGFEDEGYFPINYEDPDLCFRARLANWRVCYTPQAVSIHHESSTLTEVAPHRILSYLLGRLRFVAKFWPDERLRTAFVEAEAEWLRELREQRTAFATFAYGVMDFVYLKTLLDVDDLAAWRRRLGVEPDEARSRRTLTEVLTRLRTACLPSFQPVTPRYLAPTSDEALRGLLARWLSADESDPALQPLLGMLTSTLSLLKVEVNPHLPIAWPEWPPGVWPKLKAAWQKLVRRMLRWYIEPIVAQQNQVNRDTLQLLNALTQEVLLLRAEVARSGHAVGGGDEGPGTESSL